MTRFTVNDRILSAIVDALGTAPTPNTLRVLKYIATNPGNDAEQIGRALGIPCMEVVDCMDNLCRAGAIQIKESHECPPSTP